MRLHNFLLALILWVLIFLAAKAFAHEWYPKECCHDHDCHPVECSSITSLPYGAKQDGLDYNANMIRKSPDGFCHACFSNYTQVRIPRCLFIAFPGS